jgi:hypothetical protein
MICLKVPACRSVFGSSSVASREYGLEVCEYDFQTEQCRDNYFRLHWEI